MRLQRGKAGVLTTVMVMTIAGCGDGEKQGVTQPAPNVTTFEPGRFDDLPQYPRSEPVGPRSDKSGAVARSYRARGAAPQVVLEYYEKNLDPARWRMISRIEQLGNDTYRAAWASGSYRLRVSATREPQLDENAASTQVITQYSLTLEPI